MRRVGEARFRGEGVAFQPVEEMLAVAADDVGLRAVHMRIDEAGHQKPSPVVHTSTSGGSR